MSQDNLSNMKEEVKKLLEDIKENPSSGVSHDAKMALVQVEQIFAIDELTTEVKELKGNLKEYSAVAKKTSDGAYLLAIFLGVITVFQLFITIKQFNLSQNLGVSERIQQARMINDAIEFCNENKDAGESGLFEISTGKPASCEDVLREYGNNDSIWSKIKSFFVK